MSTLLRKKKNMIKQLFRKLSIKPKFLRKKFSNKLAKINIIETQAQELKTTNTAIKVLTKAMMFYTKYHPDAKELEINSAISFLNNQNAQTDKALSKLEKLTNDIEKR